MSKTYTVHSVHPTKVSVKAKTEAGDDVEGLKHVGIVELVRDGYPTVTLHEDLSSVADLKAGDEINLTWSKA